MIAGVGIDIVEHKRIERIHIRYGEKFERRILDELEMEEYQKYRQKSACWQKGLRQKRPHQKLWVPDFPRVYHSV